MSGRFSNFIDQYGKLFKLGQEIVLNRNKLTNRKYFAFNFSNKEYTDQLSRIGEFDKLHNKLSKEHKLYKKNIYEYWSGN